MKGYTAMVHLPVW